jgi:UDP-3-O-[3-hydroxymyristoyl] glucosamine N-acyltransferase
LVVTGNTVFEGFEIDWNDISSNTIHANTVTIAQSLSIGTNTTIGGNTTIAGNLSVAGNTNINLNEVVVGSITANALYGQANTQIGQQISDSQNTSVSTALAFSIALG